MQVEVVSHPPFSSNPTICCSPHLRRSGDPVPSGYATRWIQGTLAWKHIVSETNYITGAGDWVTGMQKIAQKNMENRDPPDENRTHLNSYFFNWVPLFQMDPSFSTGSPCTTAKTFLNIHGPRSPDCLNFANLQRNECTL